MEIGATKQHGLITTTLKFILFLYGFSLLAAGDYISEVYGGKSTYPMWLWIPISCLVLIEVLNQFTFYLAKRQRAKAVVIKAVTFWMLFTVFNLSDIFIRLQADKTGTWAFQQKWSALLILFLLSAILPWYSFCPDIRFILLYGSFSKSDITVINNFRKEDLRIWLLPLVLWYFCSAIALSLFIRVPRLLGYDNLSQVWMIGLVFCLTAGASILACRTIPLRYKRITGMPLGQIATALMWILTVAYGIIMYGWLGLVLKIWR